MTTTTSLSIFILWTAANYGVIRLVNWSITRDGTESPWKQLEEHYSPAMVTVVFVVLAMLGVSAFLLLVLAWNGITMVAEMVYLRVVARYFFARLRFARTTEAKLAILDRAAAFAKRRIEHVHARSHNRWYNR